MIIEVHLLQSFPVSNLNRDDMNQPKTATFGGQTRGRISSQCLKRAARQLFEEHGLDRSETAVRTKRLRDHAAVLLAERGRDEEAAKAIAAVALTQLGFGLDQSNGRTEYLWFVGRKAGGHLADFCERNWDTFAAVAAEQASAAGNDKSKKQAKVKPDQKSVAEARRILDARRVADVALFGRMITDNKDFSVDAASQVAHAISTHAVVNEFDYYTAVDDLKPHDEAGADMIGTVDFNTACYYRYANLDHDRLVQNLDGDTDLAGRAAHAWLRSFLHAVPSGKQNSMAARTMPETLLGVVREHGAWNLANAFLKPVDAADLMAVSTERMLEHFDQLRRFYGDTHIRAVTAASLTGVLPHPHEDEKASSERDFVARVLAPTKA